MNNNLPAIPTDSEFQVLQTISRTAAASGLYNGVGNEQKIFMILLAARELGITPMVALNGGIWNIQGKIEVSSRLMTSMIRKAGHSVVIKTINDKECVLNGKRADNGDSFDSSFTFEEAQRAGLVRTGSNWIRYPQDMLYARAMSRLARRLFPDVIGSAYVEGEIKEAKFEVIETPIEKEQVSEEIIAQKIEEFLSKHSSEDQELIKKYINKYSEHWKKSLIETLEIYEDQDKFINDFTRWKNKYLENNQK